MNVDRAIALTQVFLTLGIIVFVGCSHGEPAKPAAAPDQTMDAPPPPPPPVVPKASQAVQTKAEVGVGDKGRYDGMGPLVTPVAAYFSTKERIAFDIQIPEALKLYKAIEGQPPKTHQEFMEKIIKANHIDLPTLPAGHHYIYNPKIEELMVEKPAK